MESMIAAVESKALSAKSYVHTLQEMINEATDAGLADKAFRVRDITNQLDSMAVDVIMSTTLVLDSVRALDVTNPDCDPHTISFLNQQADRDIASSKVYLDEAITAVSDAKERKKAKDKKDEKKKSKEGKEAHEPPKKKLKTKDARNEAGGSN